jgi:uncharacterized membrane protein
MAKQTLGQRIAPARFLAFLAIFAIAFAASFATLDWTRALMTGFDIAGVFFLIAITPVLRTHGIATMRQHAAENDANRVVLLVITGVVMLAVLTAVAAEVGVKSDVDPPKGLIIATLAVAWLFSNMIYALHYAHLFYRTRGDGGLDFGGERYPAEAGPDYGDFIYFAFTLGMTFQTSDVNITTSAMRRVVTAHSFAAFVFNIGVLAFTINVLGSH